MVANEWMFTRVWAWHVRSNAWAWAHVQRAWCLKLHANVKWGYVTVREQVLWVLVWTLVCEWVWVWKCHTRRCTWRSVTWHICSPSEIKIWYGIDKRGWVTFRNWWRRQKAHGEWVWVRVADSSAHFLQHTGCHVCVLLLWVKVMIISNWVFDWSHK